MWDILWGIFHFPPSSWDCDHRFHFKFGSRRPSAPHSISPLTVSEIQIHLHQFFQLKNNNYVLSSSSLNALPVFALPSSSSITTSITGIYWMFGNFNKWFNMTAYTTLSNEMVECSWDKPDKRKKLMEFKLSRLSFYYCIYYSESCLICF